MTPKQFTYWINRVYNTRENELDCQQTQSSLPAYVEAEYHGTPFEDPAAIEIHLRQCPFCLETYKALYDLVELEAQQGELPPVAQEVDLPEIRPIPAPSELVPISAD